MRRVAAAAVGLALLVAACGGSGGSNEGLDERELIVKGRELVRGKATCAVCHGPDLLGTPMGPSFLQALYAPDRLPDSAIHDAVRNGVKQKNWDFGPMPALPHVSDADVDAIIAFIRSMQRAAGID